MQYTNPVIFSDYSDPDVIRVGEDFYMVASSFNHVPGVPVLHSKNLVEWEIVGHVIKRLPFGRFDRVCHGAGAWAPSIRYNNGKYYCLIPFPDEGIFVSETEDPAGEWSPLRPLLEGSGYEDPCPVWLNGKCYVVFAFVKSRIGFNSKLAVFETDENLTVPASDYTEIYDGHDISPNIEGPKFYLHGGYVYILAPAGGVGTGWQVALRAKDVYGPYETKIILVQGDSPANGPHQGALIDVDDSGEKWAFVHFQECGPYGRIIHLQPAIWRNDWVFCGDCTNRENLPGTPVKGGEYPVQISTGYSIDPSDEFKGGALSPVWQTPANPREGWYSFADGLRLNCVYYGAEALSDMPQFIAQKPLYRDFSIHTKCRLSFSDDGDEAGFAMFGRTYVYACAVRRGGQTYAEIRRGAIGGECDEVLFSRPYAGSEAEFSLTARYTEKNKMRCRLVFCGARYDFFAERGVWVGTKAGIYARSSAQNSAGFATFGYFRVLRLRHAEG